MNRAVTPPTQINTDNATDAVWNTLKSEANGLLKREPILDSFIYPLILDRDNFEDAQSAVLAQKLECPTLSENALKKICREAYKDHPTIPIAAQADLIATRERDPACNQLVLPFLYYKGYQGLQLHRIAHALWMQNRKDLARYIQSRMSEVFAMDIHPAAKIGRGILIDHATSIVIGETAVIGNNVSMLHEVTLGGTGKDSGDRHPKIASGVLIGAGAKILGNVHIGEGSKIGAGSVVLNNVPPHCSVAGVPAKPLGDCGCDQPALEMDHTL